ncbi:hypothetical protein [Glutamicibacter ardleyensis]|uniref:hypothetical protein n=1 Tax=Glutamicibacter ardleyensis TaxID=225894 RepID=UPI003F90B4F0
MVAHLSGMDIITDPTPGRTVPASDRLRYSQTPRAQASATLGARLAVASRHAQGLAAVVRDPVVLAELRGLCSAPRTTNRVLGETRESPAP